MPSPLPEGDHAPSHGQLPGLSARAALTRDFGLYIHVPFCAVRCGYCDFNTYTAAELEGISRSSYPAAALQEMDFAASVLEASGVPPRSLSTVFFGGGTPTLLGPDPLVRMLEHASETFGLTSQAEVTVEANPDSVSAEDLLQLASGGVTRVSFGVQSSDPGVLATLDRTHNPAQVPQVVTWAKEAGMKVSLDLIYGTPGESLASWESTLESALALEPDHLSAYALIVEAGTALAGRIKRGEIPPPDDDLHADMYVLADGALEAAGYHWYEISNWASGPENYSRHNVAYWNSEDWWGIGPGAHSHIQGVRWWNVKHPSAYSARMSEGVSPAHSREILDQDAMAMERVLLQIRTRQGVAQADIPADRRVLLAEWVSRGFLDGAALLEGRVIPTREGRLRADFLARELT